MILVTCGFFHILSLFFISFYLFIYFLLLSFFPLSASSWIDPRGLCCSFVLCFHSIHSMLFPFLWFFPISLSCLFAFSIPRTETDIIKSVTLFFLRREIKHLHFPSSILLILDQVPPSSNLTRYFQKLLLKQVVSSTRVCIKSCFFSTSYFFKKAVSWWRIFLKDEKKYPSLLPSQISAQWKESSTINKWKRRNPLFLFFLLLWYIHT